MILASHPPYRRERGSSSTDGTAVFLLSNMTKHGSVNRTVLLFDKVSSGKARRSHEHSWLQLALDKGSATNGLEEAGFEWDDAAYSTHHPESIRERITRFG